LTAYFLQTGVRHWATSIIFGQSCVQWTIMDTRMWH